MALVFCDSFQHYATDEFPRKYYTVNTSYNTIAASSGRRGGRCWQAGLTDYPARLFVPPRATYIVGFAFKTNSVQASNIITFGNGNQEQVWVNLIPSGKVGGLRYGGAYFAFSKPCWRYNTWHYLEAKVTVNDTTGVCIIKIDGDTVCNSTNVDTRYTSTDALIDNIEINHTSVSGLTYISDLYICNTDGSANNDFLGDIRVDKYAPNATGNSSGLTKSSGTYNYEMVDDDYDCDDDSTYVQSNSTGTKDTYNFPALGYTAASIKAVQVVTQMERTALANRSYCHVTRRSSTDYDTLNVRRMSNAAYSMGCSMLEVDPSTSAAWTQSNLEAAEFGVKILG